MNEFIKAHSPKLVKRDDEVKYKRFNANHRVKGDLPFFVNTMMDINTPAAEMLIKALKNAKTEVDRKRVCKIYLLWLDE
jgi:hypothetical protein